jgi:hypothetical protein
MYSIADFGGMCPIALVILVLLGCVGLAEAWPIVGCLAFLVIVAVKLYK